MSRVVVLVLSSVLLYVCFVWGACAASFESLLWSNIVAALAGSTTEALGASIVNDLFFLHERGAKMGLYMNSVTGGNTVNTFFAVLLFVPETRYHRDADQNVGLPDFTAAVASGSRVNSSEKQAVTAVASNITSPSSASLTAVPKKTRLQEARLWSGTTPDSNPFIMFFRPLPTLAYPCVIFSFLSYAVSLVITVAVNILNPFVLQAPPYNRSPSVNGLINIPVPWVEQVGYVDCFGTLVGIFVAIVGVEGALLIVLGGKIRHKQAHWRFIL